MTMSAFGGGGHSLFGAWGEEEDEEGTMGQQGGSGKPWCQARDKEMRKISVLPRTCGFFFPGCYVITC